VGFTCYELIDRKKRGRELSGEDIRAFVAGVVSGDVSDAQAAAMMMAVWFRGMSHGEAADLTLAMAESGEMLDLSGLGRCVDKHSSGGVGDKTTLVVGPLAAAAGATVVKLSGRGLGHTGGTLDKLESIPGLRTDLSAEEILAAGREVGLVVAGQTAEIAPADKRLYAVRDVTATVDSIPLIAASIMSKKLAAGAGSIVLDVKCGRGAFAQDRRFARELAELMVAIGRHAGRDMAAAITPMDAPLGRAVGNALEVREAIECLRGQGPDDLTELCLALSARMVQLSGVAETEARGAVEAALRTGGALAKFEHMVVRQGGDGSVIADPSRLPTATVMQNVCSAGDGWVEGIDALAVGRACVALGAGRVKKADRVDPAAGVVVCRGVGERVGVGDCVAVIHASDAALAENAAGTVSSAWQVGREPPEAPRGIEWV